MWISAESIFCLGINLLQRGDHNSLFFISSCGFYICLCVSLPFPLHSPQSISLISLGVVEPSEIVVGEVWLSSARVTIIFSSVCVSDSASAHSSTSHIIQLLTAQRCLQGSIMTSVIIGNTANGPPPHPHLPSLSPSVQLIPAYL